MTSYETRHRGGSVFSLPHTLAPKNNSFFKADVAGSGGTTGQFPKYWKAKENDAKIAAQSLKCLIQDPDLSTIGGIEITQCHTVTHRFSRLSRWMSWWSINGH